MRVLKFRIVSAREFESGDYSEYGVTHITAVFQNGSRTLTVVNADVFSTPLVEVYKATDFGFGYTPARFTEETVREFIESRWYVAA